MRFASESPRPQSVLTWILILILSLQTGFEFAARSAQIPNTFRAPRAVSDTPYLQELGRKIPSTWPLTTVAVHRGEVVVGTEKGLLRLAGLDWNLDPAIQEPVRRLVSIDGVLWAMTASGFHRLQETQWRRITSLAVEDVVRFRGEWVATTGDRLYRVRGDELQEWSTNACRFRVTRLVPHIDTLYVHGPGRLAPFSFGAFGGRDEYDFPADEAWDWGSLPSVRTRDALSLDSCLYVATDRGLGVLRGMSMTSVRGEQGLPFEDTTCLAVGFTNDLWIGTTRGVIRHARGNFDYFAGQRWLPDDRVRGIAVSGRTVCVATDGGLGIIEYEPYTLARKAVYYERHLEEWGQKRLGFTHKLEWDTVRKEYVREISDNDGGYSGNYLAAQCYRFAVTGDPEAHREATNTFHALRWLVAMTGIPGFPARSVWAKGEIGHQAGHGSGGYAAEWHDTSDGKFEWKGDTSSDEICSHFYSLSLFLDLVAQGREIEQARRHIAAVADHLVRNNWQLVDLDGKPTRWGRWDPGYFATDEGKYDRGLQAVELLSFLKMAEAVTNEERFRKAYQDLVTMGYPRYTLRARNTFPPESVLHFLDELAFWSWWNLLRLEEEPERRALYRRGYERCYEVIRVERNPWFNFLYGALTGNDVEAEASVEHLRSWPLDLRVWSYENSHRSDLRTPAGYVAPKGGTRTFLPRETEPLRWDRWLMQADGGAGGNDVVEPGAWLLAYWMGRFHGFIAAPTETDPSLLTIAHSLNPELGAKPYTGPARPDLP